MLGTSVLVWVLLSLPLRTIGRKEAEGLRGEASWLSEEQVGEGDVLA